MNTSTDTEVQAYLDRLRRELAGLPANEVEEILQDVEPQVTAVAAESGEETVEDRLGDPAEYARELRSALGMPDEPGRWHRQRRLGRTGLAVLAATTVTAALAGFVSSNVTSNEPRPFLVALAVGLFASWLVVGRDREAVLDIAALPELGLLRRQLTTVDQRLPVTAYLTSVRPGLRLVKAALVWLGAIWLFSWFGWLGAGGATAAVVAAVITVVAGHRAERDPRWLWLSVPLTGWAAGVGFKAMSALPQLATGSHLWW